MFLYICMCALKKNFSFWSVIAGRKIFSSFSTYSILLYCHKSKWCQYYHKYNRKQIRKKKENFSFRSNISVNIFFFIIHTHTILLQSIKDRDRSMIGTVHYLWQSLTLFVFSSPYDSHTRTQETLHWMAIVASIVVFQTIFYRILTTAIGTCLNESVYWKKCSLTVSAPYFCCKWMHVACIRFYIISLFIGSVGIMYSFTTKRHLIPVWL